jgi:hypothetical protein
MNNTKQNRKEQEHKKIIAYLKNNNGVNLQLLEPNLVLYSPCNSNVTKYDSIEDLLDIEFVPYFTNCDLICFSENDNALVILEIKTEKADYQTFGQILYYLINAEIVECANGKNVKTLRGIILAKKIDTTLKILVDKYKNKIPEIGLKEYNEHIWTKEGKLVTFQI